MIFNVFTQTLLPVYFFPKGYDTQNRKMFCRIFDIVFRPTENEKIIRLSYIHVDFFYSPTFNFY